MSDPLLDSLPMPQRLALSYASASTRAAALPLLVLDTRLAQAIRQQREPALAQIRVAWWRDLLAQPLANRPRGDRLIEGLAKWHGEEGALVELVNGWEQLIAEDRLQPAAIAAFARGRAGAFAGLHRLLGAGGSEENVALSATRWALADLAVGLSDGSEREEALAQATALGLHRVPLSRALRPLAVLDGLARRSIARQGSPILTGPASLLQALCIGMLGR